VVESVKIKEIKMTRTLAFLYGAVCYLIFFATFLYAIGFVGNLVVPKSIDAGGEAAPLITALIIDIILLSIFAIQHSVMARPTFKEWWTKVVPKPIERSTYVVFASLALILLFWQWRPITEVVWSVSNPILQYVLIGLFLIGFLIVLLSTFLINHFDLFGLRQVYLYQQGKEYTALGFRTPAFYKFVRHPIYLGFIIAFWATPVMTYGHLLFAVMTTAYILVAIQLEERNLGDEYGAEYDAYRRQVSMIVPMPQKHPDAEREATAGS
jgi:protein-S-isoprenylcysteine O-methyltransferase Ste14